MYEELISSLRLCRQILHEDDKCIEFVDGGCEAFPVCAYQLMEKAAGAIEELNRRIDRAIDLYNRNVEKGAMYEALAGISPEPPKEENQ